MERYVKMKDTMQSAQFTKILSKLGVKLSLVAVVVTMLATAIIQSTTAQSGGSFSFSPIGGSYNVGDTLTVAVRVNTGSAQTNAIRADFTYSADLLQYVSGDATGSGFPVRAVDEGSNGTVRYHRGSTAPVSGDQLIERATFKVIKAGTAVLTFKNNTVAVSSQDNEANVAPGRNNVSYTLSAAPTPPAPTPPAPTPPAPTPPAPKPAAPAPATSTQTRTPVTRITPIATTGTTTTTTTPIPLADNDTVELSTPIDVQPATIQPDGISKVEYYLDGKLVKTVAVSPYKYRLDTTKLLNGKYKLTTKTYYTNGQTDTVNQTVLVSNPFGWTQFRLSIQKYILVILLLILLIIGAVVVWIIRRNVTGGGNDGGYTGVDPEYVSPVPPTNYITPSR